MKLLETALFALALVLVPWLGWLAGRAMGRRDWRIGGVLCGAVLVAALPNVARMAVLAAFEGSPFLAAFAGRLVRTGTEHLEIGLFFVALAAFVTMIGWTSTPVAARS